MATLVKIRGIDRAADGDNNVISKNGFRVRNSTSGTKASYTTALTGTNNDLVFTAVNGGPWGNDITVTYVDPGGVSATLGVVVTGHAIVVNLGRATSAINSTGTLVRDLINGDASASALITAAYATGNNGTGLVTAMSVQTLVGGAYGDGLTLDTSVYSLVNNTATVTVDIDDPQVARILRRNHYRYVSLGLA